MKHWIDIDLDQAGDELRAGAHGSRGELSPPHALGPGAGVREFAEAVQRAAAEGHALGADETARGRALHQALFQAQVDEVLQRLKEAAAGQPVLLRLMPRVGALHAVPWEALCAPGTGSEFLGTTPGVIAVRGVVSSEPWVPRQVQGAVKVLVVAPLHETAPERLKASLRASIDSGEVEWLEPLTGAQARPPHLFRQIRQRGAAGPHILHFMGHGSAEGGTPSLQVMDEGAPGDWLDVGLLAQELRAHLSGTLRLVILEACEGARPGAFGSAAELLVKQGVDAAVAHLWPVRTDVARACSSELYRALTGAEQEKGDVARALQESRRTLLAMFGSSAEAFSPVLYLRGTDSVVFDFKARRVTPPSKAPAAAAATTVDPALQRLVAQPFSLWLGDAWEQKDASLQPFRQKLHDAVAQKEQVPPDFSLSALAEHYTLMAGEGMLSRWFQQTYGKSPLSPSALGKLADWVGPGVHVTLSRLPLLELAVATRKPDLPLAVIEPPATRGEPVTLMRRKAGSDSWESVDDLPSALDPKAEAIVLRLYRGYTPDMTIDPPLLTEDDFLLRGLGLEALLPQQWADTLLSVLRNTPALLVGWSLLAWNHRMLLHQLFERRPLPSGSLAVLEPGSVEREMWENGRGLPGKSGLPTVALALEALAASDAGGETP